MRAFVAVLALSAFTVAVFAAAPALAATSKSKPKSNPRYASIVMDADTGVILHQSGADKTLHPASLTKIMTLLLVFEKLESGDLSLRDRIPISKHAASMVPSKIGLSPGATIRLEDAIYAVVTKSANDISVALAEKIGGSESRFAALMNQKAREIGLTKTHFRNASGLHHPAQVSSARDMAKLGRHILTDYPQYYHYFSTRQFTYQGNTFRNHNRLMEKYKGMDGFKTGFVNASGFNLVASAVRNNRRIIGVVFGGQTANSRNAHMAQLLDRAFADTDNQRIARSETPPLPGRKPIRGALIAALGKVSPAAGVLDAEELSENALRWAELNPMMQSKAFAALVGEGDYDPAVGKRLETGLMAIAAVKGNAATAGSAATPPVKAESVLAHAAAPVASVAPPVRGGWSVQVGAFGSRIRTDAVLKKAAAALPRQLADAAPVIVPLKTAEGWIFRGRLSGFTQEEAQRACRVLRDCLLISPEAY